MTTSLPLTCTWTVRGERTGTLVVTGDLDYVQADQMNQVLADGLAAHPGMEAVHLDCSGIEFCDSYGLSALLVARRAATAAGVRLHLDAIRPRLEHLLRLTGAFDYLISDDPPQRAEHLDT